MTISLMEAANLVVMRPAGLSAAQGAHSGLGEWAWRGVRWRMGGR